MLKLTDNENKEIKFEDKEKNIPIVNFLLDFLARVNFFFEKKQKAREQHIEGTLVELDFQVTVKKRQINTRVR